MTSRSATSMSGSGSGQYHIGCKRGDLSENVLLVGDPSRVDRITSRFSNVRFRNSHREYVTATGTYQDLEITVMGTGMGQDNTEMALVEICQITDQPTLIRCGTTGALQETIQLGDMVISKAALRLENTSTFFVFEGYPAVGDPEVVWALAASAASHNERFHVGITASASGFYGAQSRALPGFPVRYPGLPRKLKQMNVANFEMETSTLFTLAALRGIRAGAVCTVVAQRVQDQALSAEEIRKAEDRCIGIALDGFVALAHMDRKRKERKQLLYIPDDLAQALS